MPKSPTQEQFARLVGITQQEVSSLMRKGTLTRGGTVGQWLQEYLKNLRAQAAGHKSSEGLDLIQERARLAARQSEKLEIEVAKQQGELLPIAAAIEAINFSNVTVRSKLLAIPSRFKSICSTISPKNIDLLDSLVREVLTELSDVRFPREIAERAGQYFSDLHASPKTNGQSMGRSVSSTQSGK